MRDCYHQKLKKEDLVVSSVCGETIVGMILDFNHEKHETKTIFILKANDESYRFFKSYINPNELMKIAEKTDEVLPIHLSYLRKKIYKHLEELKEQERDKLMIKLNGKIKARKYDFENTYDNGFMLFNDKDENFVLCYNERLIGHEEFIAKDVLGNNILDFNSNDGCEIYIDVLQENDYELLNTNDSLKNNAKVFSIRVKGEEKHRFIVSNTHEGYYCHRMKFGSNGYFTHTYL